MIIVRKLGVPVQPELGWQALGEDGVRVLNPEILDLAGIDGAGSMRSSGGNGRRSSAGRDSSEAIVASAAATIGSS